MKKKKKNSPRPKCQMHRLGQFLSMLPILFCYEVVVVVAIVLVIVAVVMVVICCSSCCCCHEM